MGVLAEVYKCGGGEGSSSTTPGWCSTHGREPHSLDVVQLVDNPLIRPTAINPIRGIAWRTRRPVAACEPVGQHLVYGPGAPLRGCCGVHGKSTEDSKEEDGAWKHGTCGFKGGIWGEFYAPTVRERGGLYGCCGSSCIYLFIYSYMERYLPHGPGSWSQRLGLRQVSSDRCGPVTGTSDAP